ncbi:hypothetical protein [Thermosulfurimonas dismutans]|nr:hypothetical protein [Thermosulfurimonas dismutans]
MAMGGVSPLACLPVFSAVSVSAVAFGGGAVLRRSSRSLSGFVAWCWFPSWGLARRWASFWAGRLPAACRGVVVRRAPFPASGWVVSVPVLPRVGACRG